jgi:asparagine synthase (glutamine-hydrolysing)
MSGIVGILNLDGAPVDRDLLWRMTRYLAPRGPDAQDVWIEGPVGFGHAMLRTTWEAQSEHQPLTLDGETWITADCRIDARDELIAALVSRGSRVEKNAPDPEVILHAYALWGEDCLVHLLGDFSFAIWDGRARRLFAARDHFGIKAFFYARAGQSLVFSNLLNCVRLYPGISNRLDEVAIADFLMFGNAQDFERTTFSAIRRLPPAHVMTISGSEPHLRRYWELPVEDELRYRRAGDYVENFRHLLEVATRDRLRTDKVVVLMSGGLDSPSIAATAHQILSASGAPFELRAHTVVYDRLVPDHERKYSQAAADKIGIPIHHYPLDDYPRFPPGTPEPEGYPPEPGWIFDPGGTVELHRKLTQTSRVLLSGYGADSLVDGPGPELVERLVSERYYGRIIRELVRLMWSRGQIPRFGIRTFLRKAIAGKIPPELRSYPQWFNPELERRLDLKSRWLAIVREQDSWAMNPARELSRAVFWPWLLEYSDPGSMLLPAEARFPYFDVRFVRYLLRVPPFPWRVEKNILRLAMKDYLPNEVLKRRKTPIAGNPLAKFLEPASTFWWEQYLVPGHAVESFVALDAARAEMARVLKKTQEENRHEDFDVLRLALRPIALRRWFQRQIASS